jgi:hypothetical protein
MKIILNKEIVKEMPNSQALGGFNDAIALGASMAQGYIDSGDKKSAIEFWSGAMRYGVKDTKNASAKEKKGITSAYAQAIGADRVLKRNG